MKTRWPLLACVRYREVLIMQGPPLMGVFLSVGRITANKIPVIVGFGMASFLLVAHIWSLNDWADIQVDKSDLNKSAGVFSRNGVNAPTMLWFSITLFVASLGLFAVLGRQTLLIAVCIAGLGLLYSHSGINTKGTPVLSSMTHLLGGVLHFLLGYSLFADINGNAILIASFFALTFAAGHATQEAQDYEGDRRKGIRTNAVVFGKKTVFLSALAGFTVAYGDLLYLALAGIVPTRLGLLPPVLFPLHLFWSLETLRSGLTHENINRLRRLYQTLFALIGLDFISTVFL